MPALALRYLRRVASSAIPLVKVPQNAMLGGVVKSSVPSSRVCRID